MVRSKSSLLGPFYTQLRDVSQRLVPLPLCCACMHAVIWSSVSLISGAPSHSSVSDVREQSGSVSQLSDSGGVATMHKRANINEY